MKIALLCLILTMTGCASGRFLSEKEDADMRKTCMQGCTVMPNSVLKELLGRIGVGV